MRSSLSLLRRSATSRSLRRPHSVVARRYISSSTHDDQLPEIRQSVDTPPDELEKPKRRSKTSTASTAPINKDLDPLPRELDILWTADVPNHPVNPSDQPPPEILQEALHNLHIILHPQTQHRAIYTSTLGPPIEPTFALYCPIEGGDYVVDATVMELAKSVGAEVVVLDAVQLAAGEWGMFGKAANSLQLPRNPLHFPSAPPTSSRSSRAYISDDDLEGDMPPPTQMTVAVMTPLPIQPRTLMPPPQRRNPAPSKMKILFDELVNVPTKNTPPETVSTTPRIIYIRDFPTLAPSSAIWYPPLLSAIRQRRQGPISRPTSPISNPMAVIFGMTPPLTEPISRSPHSSSASGRIGIDLSTGIPVTRSHSATNSPTPANNDKPSSLWGEDDQSTKARELRLRNRLKKWENGDKSLVDELPGLTPGAGSGTNFGNEGDLNGTRSGPEIVLVSGGPEGMSMPAPSSFALPAVIPSIISGGSSHFNRQDANDGSNSQSRFFRTLVVVPSMRDLERERRCRVERRREINELTMKMGVGGVGGELVTGRDRTGQDEVSEMWEDWGRRVESWAMVKQIADRAVGSVVAGEKEREKVTLEATQIPWSAVEKAWMVQRSTRELRTAWAKGARSRAREHLKIKREGEEVKESEDVDMDEDLERESESESEKDEVVEKIKQDQELDPHEQQLLSCIVNPATMPTSFDHVHLPPHTIDSVRTVVSLPLLYPAAFQQGILKSHGINGVLLFGPPGTGKTLVARALAKEAGCRMMAINPSDVMDMYVGEGEKLVKSVFSLARRLSPCVVFLDEIDALFGARLSARESGSAFAHRGVITEFMQEMDGLRSSSERSGRRKGVRDDNKDRVIVIGATNRPFDLDDAVLRRMPRRLLLDLPGEREREEILKIHLRGETLDSDIDVKVLAKKTESFSGSDLKHLCVSAALDAVKESVKLPWKTSSDQPNDASDTDTNVSQSPASSPHRPNAESDGIHVRVLSLRHFNKALKEIIPSSSESLGSLADLRKWNEEFGEGRADRKRQQVWGKGTFGFVEAEKNVEVTPTVIQNVKGDQ